MAGNTEAAEARVEPEVETSSNRITAGGGGATREKQAVTFEDRRPETEGRVDWGRVDRVRIMRLGL